ncbi:MAG: DUF4097 family beta strand repeat-containing protein [Bacillota bacterium]
MTVKRVTTTIIIILLVIMVMDFRLNGDQVFGNYFKGLETESLTSLEFIRTHNFTADIHESKGIDREYSRELERLVIDDNTGSIIITGEERDELEVNAEIKVFADNRQDARTYLEELSIEEKEEDQVLWLSLIRKEHLPSIRGVKVNYRIRAPRQLSLELASRLGEVRVNGFDKQVNLETRLSEARLSNIDGELNLISKYGGVELMNIRGQTSIEADYSQINISGLENRLKARLKYGELRGQEVRGDIDINSEYADLSLGLGEADNVKLDCENKYGHIQTDILEEHLGQKDRVQRLKGRLGNGTRSVKVRSRYGDLIIESGSY